MRLPYGIVANHSGLMNTLALSPVAINDIVVWPIPSLFKVTLMCICIENEFRNYGNEYYGNVSKLIYTLKFSKKCETLKASIKYIYIYNHISF